MPCIVGGKAISHRAADTLVSGFRVHDLIRTIVSFCNFFTVIRRTSGNLVVI
jgi:hypothetical protein